LVVGAALASYFGLFGGGSTQRDDAEKYKNVAPALDQRIQSSQIRPLENEPLEQNLLKLSDVDMYIWPGAPSSMAIAAWLPLLQDDVGRNDQHAVMSNRRFLKILHDLSRLTPDEAAGIVRHQLHQHVAKYTKLFDEDTRNKKELLAPGGKAVGVAHRVTNEADGKPTLVGARYGVFALVMLAGHLQLKKAHGAVLEVATQANSQYETFCEEGKFNRATACMHVVDASLYNRQILAVGLLGTSSDGEEMRRIVKKLEAQWKKQDLPTYDAHATPYDLHARSGVIPVDLSKGKITVRYLDSLSDSGFREILAAGKAAK
jgi:hypothetical protein